MAIFCGGRERTNLFSPRDEEERGRAGRRARKKRSEREQGSICPEEKSHQARYTGITPLVRSARGSSEIPGPGPDERIYRRVQDASTPTYDGPSNDILLARLVTPHLPARLPLSSVSPSAGLSTSLFLSLLQSALSRCFLVGGSQPAATFATAEQSPRPRRS